MHRGLSTVPVRFQFKISIENTGIIILVCTPFCVSKKRFIIFNVSFRKIVKEDILICSGE